MALILKLLGEAKQNPIREAIDTDGWVYDKVCKNPKCICQTEQELPMAAKLAEGNWRCVYCEQKV
jgi:aspartate carbamoyltransferase regulatory subunit